MSCDDKSKNDIENCVFLCGKGKKRSLKVTHIIITDQKGRKKSCETLNEENFYYYATENNFRTFEWIHTHPTQSSFLSSIDIHSQYKYQSLLLEAILVVCSLKTQVTDLFTLTPDGMKTISQCDQTGFHDHAGMSQSIYVKASHIVIDEELIANVIDLR